MRWFITTFIALVTFTPAAFNLTGYNLFGAIHLRKNNSTLISASGLTVTAANVQQRIDGKSTAAMWDYMDIPILVIVDNKLGFAAIEKPEIYSLTPFKVSIKNLEFPILLIVLPAVYTIYLLHRKPHT